MKRFWTMSLRTRLMIIGLAGVGIALIMGGLAFYGALTYSVNRTLDNEALASAEEVAEMVNENRLPSRCGSGQSRQDRPMPRSA